GGVCVNEISKVLGGTLDLTLSQVGFTDSVERFRCHGGTRELLNDFFPQVDCVWDLPGAVRIFGLAIHIFGFRRRDRREACRQVRRGLFATPATGDKQQKNKGKSECAVVIPFHKSLLKHVKSSLET